MTFKGSVHSNHHKFSDLSLIICDHPDTVDSLLFAKLLRAVVAKISVVSRCFQCKLLTGALFLERGFVVEMGAEIIRRQSYLARYC